MTTSTVDPRERYEQHLKQILTNCYECEHTVPHDEIIWRGRCRRCCVKRLEWVANNCECEEKNR